MKESPRVLQVVTRMGLGGVPTQVALLIRTLGEHGYPSSLVVGRCIGGEEDMSYLLREGDPVIPVPEMHRSFAPVDDLVALWKLIRIIRETRPMIVHSHTAKAGLLARIAARVSGVPAVVHTFHGNVLSGYFSEPVSKSIRFIERLLARITDKVCVVSPQQADEICDHFHIAGREKVHVLPVGVDLEPFAAITDTPPADGVFTVGWLGRMAPVKNIPLLVETAAETLGRSDRVRFLVAGDGEDRALAEEAEKRFGKDRFQFLGWQRDTRPFLGRCHVLLQTSRNEGTPGALLHGMAARRPFVSTAAGGVVDLVYGPVRLEAGGARWYANGVLTPENPQAMAQALLRLSQAPHLVSQMGNSGRELVLDQYSLEMMIENTVRLYDSLLASRVARKRALSRRSAA